MEYKAKISLSDMDLEESLDEELSPEVMNKYLDEYLSGQDWDEELLTDDFDEIDRKVEYFSARIAELEAELNHLNKQSNFSVSDSSSIISNQREDIEYRIEIFEDQKGILIGHKEILEGKGIPNELVFAELQEKLDAMKLESIR